MLLAVAACDSGVIKADETAMTATSSQSSLSAVKDAIEAPPVIETNYIDPAAKNIDPFSRVYTDQERESFSAAVQNAAAQEGYLDASIKDAETLLIENTTGIEVSAYQDGLTCAARFEIASRDGALSANRAQDYARDVLNATAIGFEDAIRSQNAEAAAKEAVTDYRQMTYVNYALTRDGMLDQTDGKAVLAEAETCYAALGLQPDETISSDISTETEQENIGES